MNTIPDFVLAFSSVLWEALPFVVLGAVVAGVLEELLPQQLVTRLLPRGVLPAVVAGALLGLAFPMCECGIVVVIRRLLRKGLPLACCVSYMMAGPIINVVVILSTWVAFGPHGIAPEVVGLRVGLGFVVAVTTGLVVQRFYSKYGNSLLAPAAVPPPESPTGLPVLDDAPAAPSGPRARRVFDGLGRVSSTAVHDFVDITVFLILGSILAAVAKLFVPAEDVTAFSTDYPLLAVPVMMGFAFLMCLCSEADAFVAATFTHMHISAKVAFLVFGPMLDIKLLLMYFRIFRPRLIVVIVTCSVTLTYALCVAVQFLF